jgi:aspartate/methionine/tyrosine aminotransferase
MDFSEFLTGEPRSDKGVVESEESKDARERSLYLELMHEFGLLFTPGRSMRAEYPGFFRCVFTAASDSEFALGLDRIKKYVKAKRS